MENSKKNLGAFLVPISIVLAGIMVSGGILAAQKKNEEAAGDVESAETVDTTASALTEGTFKYYDGTELLMEDGLPVVVLFSTETCSHCSWIADTFDNVAKEYQDSGKVKAYHFNYTSEGIVDTLSGEVYDTIPTEIDNLITVYGEGYVPTFIMGGKYFRVGNAYESADDLASEEKEFRRVIDLVVEETK